MFAQFCIVVALCLAIIVNGAANIQTRALGSYNIVPGVTVSGVSAGAYMAVQMHIAHSSIINGSAIFAGGPFYCAESNLVYAEKKCMDVSMGPPETMKLVTLTYDDAALNLVDNPKNLADDRIYLFSGKSDSVIRPKVMEALQSYYLSFAKSSNLVADFNVNTEHCFPTLNYGEPCLTLSTPYLGKCGFDGAGAAFTTLYGNSFTRGQMVASNLYAFDQTPFMVGVLHSLDTTGYVYVPTVCADGKTACRLHISFHGCEQTLSMIGNQYATYTGLNEWAEANKVIVVYPYIKEGSAPYNPNGCWDWWSYTGVDYGVKSGLQIQFIRRIITAISGI